MDLKIRRFIRIFDFMNHIPPTYQYKHPRRRSTTATRGFIITAICLGLLGLLTIAISVFAPPPDSAVGLLTAGVITGG